MNEEPTRGLRPASLVEQFLEEQQALTAVERFARLHATDGVPAQQRFYRDLIPLTPPGPGEQFAFEVDLDQCSGCKACVSACHALNGLDEGETWRRVGLLISEGTAPHAGAGDRSPGADLPVGPCLDLRTAEFGFLQHLTSACHHCIDPACLSGCPVLAYDKDPITGIVRHLDDQCIGCQYCILKCPYDVPQYSARRGIVRKCDLCANRLAVAEAPACVQACPNEAIRITIVSQAAVARQFRTSSGSTRSTPALAGVDAVGSPPWPSGVPEPSYTLPTTRYVSRRPWPRQFLGINPHHLQSEPPHSPLGVMLVLTQLSVGAFTVDTLLRALFPGNLMTRLSPFHAVAAFAIGVIALLASTLHLGRPLGAWRAVLGLKQSWLSREIVAFGLFAGLAMAAAGFRPAWRMGLDPTVVGTAVSVTGLLGVFCSAMIYRDTPRAFWDRSATTWKFFGTTAVLGTAAILFLTTWQALRSPEIAGAGAYPQLTGWLTVTLASLALLKLVFEARVFRHRRAGGTTPLKSAALLMTSELAEIATARFLAGLIGSVVLPVVFLARQPAPGFATLGMTLWILLLSVLGELLERRLFFAAAVAPRMPAGIIT
ncbi:MAG: dimethyl sulfoxide reductase anchor subunit [Verrucomicrobia bacterium]|nr:dimethyl sulfoxide reductase anchor subunit [Verrucomicrobiota bacterium]